MQEQEFDIIALWTVPFGGNSEARLRQAEVNLGAEICGWTAAVEALTAFIKSYVVPHLSTRKEGILLQPVIGYLNGALTYISSTTLQQATSEFKQSVNSFLMRTLMAYHALPDPFCYEIDHNALLSICTAPFREPALWGESSCLRQLLDYRDASLGPWIPGRDSFEDELRVFEGGLDGPFPCVWENDISAFPQPLSVSLMLLNQKLLCFGSIFATQREAKKLQLLDIVEGSMKMSKKQSFHEGNATNVCVALLQAVKETLRLRSSDIEPEVHRRLQLIFQGLLAEEGTSVAQRRAAAEGLGILARLGDDVFAARLMRSLLADATSALDINLRGSIAFALGCIHGSKGGMALSVLVPSTVQILCSMARDSKALLHRWALHGLWLTTEAAGLAFVPHVQATMGLVMDALLSEDHTSPDLQQSLGRLINAIVAVIGPELSPGSSFFSRCKSVVAEIAFGQEPAALLESVLFTQQLVLFAPQAVSFHTHVQTLTPTLCSKQPSLRQAAVSTLHHLAERDPISMIDERIEEKLFAMLDTETNGGIIKLVRLTLLCLLEAACPIYPSRWLLLCKNVVLATSSTISAGNNSKAVFGRSQTTTKSSNLFEGDEEEMISRVGGEGSSLHGSEGVESKLKEGDQLPRYSTRLFAAECLSRLPYAVGEDNRHFNLLLVREDADFRAGSKSGDWLVNHLGQLVALAYQVATGVFERLRSEGVMLLVTIIKKFGMYEDPDFNGHLLLEQYQAQFVSAVRTALDLNAGPLLLDAGLQLGAMIITSGISNGDEAVFRRVLSLMSNLLSNFEDLQFPPYAEWVGCKVQVSLLCAYASVKRYAYLCMTEASKRTKEGLALRMLVLSDSNFLRELWIGLLRDVTMLQMYPIFQLQTRYSPFLGGLLLPAVTAVIQPLLDEVWPVVFEALTIDARKTLSSESKDLELTDESSSGGKKDPGFACQKLPLTLMEFNQLWLMSFSMLCQRNRQRRNTPNASVVFDASTFKSVLSNSSDNSLVIAFQGLHCLCEEGLEHSSCLTTELCEELFQVLLCIKFKSQITASKYIMPILKQVVKSSPDEYFLKEEWVSALIEACVYHGRQLICSELVESGSEADKTVYITFETFQILAQRLSGRHNQLLPIVLSLVANFVIFSDARESVFSMALSVIVAVTSMLFKSAADQQFFVVATIVQSAAETVKSLIENGISKEGNYVQAVADNVCKLSVLLDLLVRVSQTVLESGSSGPQRDLIVSCCVKCFNLTLTASCIETQLIGLQTLRMVAQTAIANSKQGSSYELALLLMKELGVAVVSVVYIVMKSPLTSKGAVSIGERLKLVLLLLSLVEGDEQHTEVMHILLPAIICAASPDTQTDLQIAAGLKMVAMKLVTHLASQANLALPFRTALSHMPIHLRQNLQEIIRASISHQTATVDPAPAFAVTAQKLVITPSVMATISSEAAANSSPSEIQSVSTSENEKEEGDDDEDWDDFQSHLVESDAQKNEFNDIDSIEVAAASLSQSGASESHPEACHGLENCSDLSDRSLHDQEESREESLDFESFECVSRSASEILRISDISMKTSEELLIQSEGDMTFSAEKDSQKLSQNENSSLIDVESRTYQESGSDSVNLDVKIPTEGCSPGYSQFQGDRESDNINSKGES
ncbi:hypothetical protein L7F22_027985 [Adiantum nelumboides]|nr:hypothetical protein [Adiantum nelumboides]